VNCARWDLYGGYRVTSIPTAITGGSKDGLVLFSASDCSECDQMGYKGRLGMHAEALAIATQISPTVILQDLVMPGVNGLTLVRHYRENPVTKDIPIVMLSTNDDPATKSESFSLGANDYLVKLPDKIELIARIRYHSKGYLTQLQNDEANRALRASQKQLLEMNIELQRLTNIDGLTAISNRRYFDEYM
jgi:two-component system chemotaxis family response regulator WspR